MTEIGYKQFSQSFLKRLFLFISSDSGGMLGIHHLHPLIIYESVISMIHRLLNSLLGNLIIHVMLSLSGVVSGITIKHAGKALPFPRVLCVSIL